MDFSLNEDQKAIKDLANQIFSDRSTDNFQLEFSRNQEAYDNTLWDTLGQQGLLGISIPNDFGGAGLGLLETCLVLEEQGRCVSPVPLFSSLVLGAMPITKYGTQNQKEKILPSLASGDLKLTAAISEIAMSSAIAKGINARKTEFGWVLNGSLDCIQDGAVADYILAPATHEDGEKSIFIIKTDTTNTDLQPQDISLLGPWSASLSLEDMPVNPADLLGEVGQGKSIVDYIEKIANVGQCALQTGVCEEAMRRTAAYTSEREQFGVPIGSFQALAMRMADSYIDVEAMRSTFWLALWRLNEGLPADAEIRAAKWWACEGAHRVVHTAQHLHAGIGADIEYPIHRFYLWAKYLSYSLGNSSYQLEKLGELLASDDYVGYSAISVDDISEKKPIQKLLVGS